MSKPTPERIPRRLHIVYREKLRCPECGGLRLKVGRTVQVDDATVRYIYCLDCPTSVKMVLD